MHNSFPVGSKVRFTQERLALLSPRDRGGLGGRIGAVQANGRRASKPTVHFPQDGARAELRLFAVDQKHLELVEGPPQPEETSLTVPAANPSTAADLRDSLFDTAVVSGATETSAATQNGDSNDGGGKLSQSETDNLFD